MNHEYARDGAHCDFRRTPHRNDYTYEMRGPGQQSWHPVDPLMRVAHPEQGRGLVRVQELEWHGESPQ